MPATNKTLGLALEDALAHLDKFLDPNNAGCSVPAEVRETARIYLDTWVRTPLHAAKLYNEGERDWQLLDYMERLGR